MNWPLFNPQTLRSARKERFATAAEIKAAFACEWENLSWIAFVITGDRCLAERAIVDASGLQRSSSGVFQDWLTRWAQSATMRAAAASVRGLITEAASRYVNSFNCEHTCHEVLAERQVITLRQLEPTDIIANLDPLARAVLLLRGIQHASLSECSLLLGVSRQAVARAYCHALSWFFENVEGHQESDSLPSAPLCAGGDKPK
jgi:hypothetical protein